MNREFKRRRIAEKRHNQAFNTYTNKQVEDLKVRLLQLQVKNDVLQTQLKEARSQLLQERKSSASLRQYKAKAAAYIKTLSIKPITLEFGTNKDKLDKAEVFKRYRTENIRTFITLATECYNLNDEQVARLYAALNAVSDETLAAFIKKHKLRAAFYESSEELVSGEGFSNISYTYIVNELEGLA